MATWDRLETAAIVCAGAYLKLLPGFIRNSVYEPLYCRLLRDDGRGQVQKIGTWDHEFTRASMDWKSVPPPAIPAGSIRGLSENIRCLERPREIMEATIPTVRPVTRSGPGTRPSHFTQS